MARPTAFNPEVAAIICKAVREGCGRRDAAAHAGLSESVFYKWLSKGKQESDPTCMQFVEFVQAVKKAESDCIADYVAQLNLHAEKTWQACAWVLERLRPRRFGDPRREIRELRKLVEELLKRVPPSVSTPDRNGTQDPGPASLLPPSSN